MGQEPNYIFTFEVAQRRSTRSRRCRLCRWVPAWTWPAACPGFGGARSASRWRHRAERVCLLRHGVDEGPAGPADCACRSTWTHRAEPLGGALRPDAGAVSRRSGENRVMTLAPVPHRPLWQRVGWTAAGAASLALGVLGIFLPMLHHPLRAAARRSSARQRPGRGLVARAPALRADGVRLAGPPRHPDARQAARLGDDGAGQQLVMVGDAFAVALAAAADLSDC